MSIVPFVLVQSYVRFQWARTLWRPLRLSNFIYLFCTCIILLHSVTYFCEEIYVKYLTGSCVDDRQQRALLTMVVSVNCWLILDYFRDWRDAGRLSVCWKHLSDVCLNRRDSKMTDDWAQSIVMCVVGVGWSALFAVDLTYSLNFVFSDWRWCLVMQIINCLERLNAFLLSGSVVGGFEGSRGSRGCLSGWSPPAGSGNRAPLGKLVIKRSKDDLL